MAEKPNKRDLILAAAREILGEKGYHSTTSEEIAKRAGVGKGTIYQYFESKHDIFLQMHIQYLQQYSESVSALIHEDSTFEEICDYICKTAGEGDLVITMGGGDIYKAAYLIREDIPSRKEHPPEVLRGDPKLTAALINSIERRWKFTSGVLAWHPDDDVNEAQERDVMDAFERVAFAGLEADQRHILWVRHRHAGHHELHFLIPRMELSSGKDFNACPPGWQKDFAVFRDLFNWREGWARPDDPARSRDFLPDKADLLHAQAMRWNRKIKSSDRDEAKAAITERLKYRLTQGDIKSREDVLRILKEEGLHISRAGRDYIGVVVPESGDGNFKHKILPVWICCLANARFLI